MNAFIDYSRITRTYYVRLESKRAPIIGQSTRKDEAERLARKAGATAVEHWTRDPVRDLERFLGFSHEGAKRTVRLHFS